MNNRLSAVERRLVEEIVRQHCHAYPSLADQLDRLRVIDREPTGVGAYINFSVSGPIQDEAINVQLGFEGEIQVEGVPWGLGCVMLVQAGRIHYLELFTYPDDTWDGNLDSALIIPANS
jgi:hypothetical protein